jgi:hypothetical protein
MLHTKRINRMAYPTTVYVIPADDLPVIIYKRINQSLITNV